MVNADPFSFTPDVTFPPEIEVLLISGDLKIYIYRSKLRGCGFVNAVEVITGLKVEYTLHKTAENRTKLARALV